MNVMRSSALSLSLSLISLGLSWFTFRQRSRTSAPLRFNTYGSKQVAGAPPRTTRHGPSTCVCLFISIRKDIQTPPSVSLLLLPKVPYLHELLDL